MESVDPKAKELMDRLIAAKEERRKRLAALPFEKKIRIIVRMQEMLAPIYRARGIDVEPWKIDWPEGTAISDDDDWVL